MGRYHVRNYSEIKEADLLAVSDPNPEVRKLADEYGIPYYTDFEKMLKEVKPDAVSVAVPTQHHLSVGKAVLNSGCHLLMEKPIASTVKEADELIKLAKKNKVIFTVGHIERYNPIVRKLRELVDQKKIGTITSIVSKRVGGFPAVEPKTDVIIDLAVHDIEIISFLLNKYPKQIYTHGSRTLHSQKVDAAELLLDFGDSSGFIQANWITPVKIRTIAVTGSEGYVEGNYITQELVYYQHNMKRVNNKFKNFVGTFGDPKQHVIPIKFKEPLKQELEMFIKTVLGKKEFELVDPRDARQALHLALTAIRPFEGKK